MKKCSVLGCHKTSEDYRLVRGLCKAHYHKLRRYGNPLYKKPTAIKKPCTIDGCSENIKAKGLCQKHYLRYYRTGRTDKSFRDSGTGCYCINSSGYSTFQIHKKQYMMHRIIMEKHLGRKLLATEVVHHINGNRSDNRIENLRLFRNVGEHTSYHNSLRFNPA